MALLGAPRRRVTNIIEVALVRCCLTLSITRECAADLRAFGGQDVLVDVGEDESAAKVLAGLANQFVDLARVMVADQPEQSLSTARVLEFAAKAVPGSQEASVTRVTAHSRPKTVAATGELPGRVSALQYELGEGPCLEALDRSDIVFTNDLSRDNQWPKFGPRAVEGLGVRSLLSFRLFLTSRERASLNFFSREPDAFDPMSLSIGAIFASYASLTLMNDFHRDQNMHLRRALESNREIGMAMGILMARDLCTSEEAFARLRVASAHLHRRLHDLAEEVIQTGALPEAADPV